MVFAYLAGAFFLALVYPYAIYPLLLRLLKSRELCKPCDAETSELRAALLLCAYNEEKSLPSKIKNIRAIRKCMPELEVHVYADACTDASLQLLKAAGDTLVVHEGYSRVGKATGMRILVDSTEADILIFTDANVIVEPDSIPRLVSYFKDPHIGTVAGTLHYVNSEDSTVAQTGSIYWRLEEMIKKLESKTGSTMGADGSLFATRRSLYPKVPPNLLDDMIASISPLFRGFRVVSVADVRAFEKATVDSRDEFKRKRRIACRAFNTHVYLRPQLRSMSFVNRFKYTSHKFIRWFSAVFLIGFLLSFIAAIAALVGGNVAIVVGLSGVALAFAARTFDLPLLGGLVEVALSLVATGVGILESIAGRDYQTWAPARGRQE